MIRLFSRKLLPLLALLALMLTGCSNGGGGGGTDPNSQNKPEPGSSDWNQMIWNKDNWS